MKIIKDIIKAVRSYLDVEELDIDDIPPMRYPKGQEHEREEFVNPFTKYNSHNSRLRYRR